MQVDLFGNTVPSSTPQSQHSPQKTNARDNRPFKLTDTLFQLDKRSTWIEYRRLLSEGYDPNELLPVVWWAFKSVMQVKSQQPGVHAFVATKIKPLFLKLPQEALVSWILSFLEVVIRYYQCLKLNRLVYCWYSMDSEVLPSAHFVKSIAALAVVFAVVWGAYRYGDSIKTTVQGIISDQQVKKDQEAVDAYSDYRDLDSDKDGLLDWEEAIFGTDPEKTDSDGDGKTDQQEFIADQSNVTANNLDLSEGSALGDGGEDLTATDSLARDLYTSISIAKQQNDGKLADGDRDELAEIAAKSLQTFNFPSYTVDQLTVTEGGTQATKSAFIKEALKVSGSLLYSQGDLRTVLVALDKGSSISPDLKSKISSPEKLPLELLKVKVPESLSGRYILYINAVSAYQTAIMAIGNNDTEPSRAVAAIVALSDILDNLKRQSEFLMVQ
jgi:hypothetical protein